MIISLTRIILLIILPLFFAMQNSLLSGVDEDEMVEKLPVLLGQENMGRDFWFSIPPVYEQVAGDNFVKVFITSEVETDVVIQVEDKGLYQKKRTIPNGVINFELRPSDVQPISHSYSVHKSPSAKIYPGIGVNITSDAPILVYVVVKYKYTSDGFLALPVSGLGDRYVNMVYQDPGLGGNGSAPAFTTVIGAYDNTEITMTMGGGPNGNDTMLLEGGRKIGTGQKTSFRLNKGDVWMGASNGDYLDISGSLFEGTKPFAIVSGMHCANFPIGNTSCDYTIEMEFPTHAWGKQYYVTPTQNRTFNGIVRVFASEPNTSVYRSGELIGELTHGGGNTIGKAYMEFRLWNKTDVSGDTIPPKIATIHSNKPIAVMYYNTGTQEDGGGNNSDPFQMQFVPVEQASNHIIFPSPNSIGGVDNFIFNYVNVIYELSDDSTAKDLLFSEMKTGVTPEWKELSEIASGDPEIFTEEYEGKKYGTVTINLPSEGVFSLKSDSTKFVAYSYGFSDFESYGFPTFSPLRYLDSPDMDVPIPLYVQEDNGDILRENGSVRDMPDDPDIRSNMAEIYMTENLNDNYILDYRIPGTNGKDFIPGEQRTLLWWLTVVDKSDSAKASITFVDRAGNDTTITICYAPTDTLVPIPTYVQDCHGDIIQGQGSVTDMPDDEDFRSNMGSLSIKENLNDNYLFNYQAPGAKDTNFVPGEHRTISWWLTVIDKSRPALATLEFKDETGNDTSITVSYIPVGLNVVNGNDFGTLFEDEAPKVMQDTIRNTSNELPLYITRVELKDNDEGFSIVGFEPDTWSPGMPIDVGDEVLINIQFDPSLVNANSSYSDSLGVGYGNDNYDECSFSFLTQQNVDTRVTSVNQLAKSQYNLFPNPTKNSISIYLEDNISINEYELYDLEGNTIIKGDGNKSSTQTINVESLTKGMYIIEITTSNNKFIRDKFIKQD